MNKEQKNASRSADVKTCLNLILLQNEQFMSTKDEMNNLIEIKSQITMGKYKTKLKLANQQLN